MAPRVLTIQEGKEWEMSFDDDPLSETQWVEWIRDGSLTMEVNEAGKIIFHHDESRNRAAAAVVL